LQGEALTEKKMLQAIYILLCLLMGLMGMNRKFGFWGYFFGSIVLTPVIGLLLLLASDPRKQPDAAPKS
jgi:hypothetical protein